MKSNQQADTYAIDSHKLIYHPVRTAEVLQAAGSWEKSQKVYPLYMEISPIGVCNHRCLFCAVDYIGYNTERLPLALFQERLPEMARLGVKSVMFAGEGEPLLHKDMGEILQVAHKAGLDSALTTNATILPPGFIEKGLPALSWIKISINGGTPEGYQNIHRSKAGDFEKVIQNMKTMVDSKRARNLDCTLGAQALLLPDNADQMARLVEICRDEVGLDYLVIKPYSQHLFSETKRYETIDYEAFLSLGESLSQMGKPGFSVIFRGKTMQKYSESDRYDHCYATPFLWGYIMANGIVSGCSAYLLDERFEYGNLKEQGFQEIWEGERRRKGWQFIQKELDIQNCRKNCRMDEINRYLHTISTGSVPHLNFI
ncbi:MAG: radical SAM protein [Magnetococcales bacterium]|nr:radical SAM protein [Magnetococcales bacterium]